MGSPENKIAQLVQIPVNTTAVRLDEAKADLESDKDWHLPERQTIWLPEAGSRYIPYHLFEQ